HEPPCTPAEIVDSLGMSMADLFRREPGRVSHTENNKADTKVKPERRAYPNPEGALAQVIQRHGKPTAHWPYPNADGSESFRVYRFDFMDARTGKPDKDFRPVHPTLAGWILGDPPGLLPLYHLPDLSGAPRVFVCEGEKAAERARDQGVVATTSAHGAQ